MGEKLGEFFPGEPPTDFDKNSSYKYTTIGVLHEKNSGRRDWRLGGVAVKEKK